MNLKLLLEEKSRQYGGKTAVALGQHKLSYADLDEASNKVASYLVKTGLKRGDRVAMLLPNSLEFVVVYFGVVKACGIAVPLDVRYKFAELASLFNNARPKVLVAESLCLQQLASHLSGFNSIKQIIEVGSHFKGQFLNYEEFIAEGSPEKLKAEPQSEDVAHIGYTSGPTTRPRGVVLTHQSLTTEAAISGDGFKQTSSDVVLLFALPMHHVFGLVLALLGSISKGSKAVISTETSPNSLLELIEKERGTMFMGVPYIFGLLVNIAEKEGVKQNLSSLRLCISGGASLPDDIALRFKQHFGLDIIQVWGLTESVASVTCGPVAGPIKLGSAGKVLPGWELKIVDEGERELPANHSGEVIVKGPIMKGYYQNAQDTAAAISDGWLYTGDIGWVDDDGYLFITGRKKETIIVKGQNIYRSDIEEVLRAHPKVSEAAVVVIPDKLRGEVVRAVISLKPKELATADEIRRFCRQHMADYKLPKQIIFLDSLPKTAKGEINRENLKGDL